MAYRLTRVAAIPFASVCASIHGLIGLVLGCFVAGAYLMGVEIQGIMGMGVWAVLIFPLMNFIGGFIIGLLLAALYNFIVQIGGRAIELEVQEIS